MTETVSALMLTGDMTAGGAGVAGGADVAAGAGADCWWTGAGVPHPTAASHAAVITTIAMLNDSRVMVCPFSRAYLRGSEKVQERATRAVPLSVRGTSDRSTSSHVGAERHVQKSTSASEGYALN